MENKEKTPSRGLKNPIKRLVLGLFSALFWVYKVVIGPALHALSGSQGGACNYPHLTCSEYSKEAIKKLGVVRGLWMSLLRILSCNPWMRSKESLMFIREESSDHSCTSPEKEL